MREVEGDINTYTLRGQEFSLSSPAWECPDTGERYFTPEQGNVFLARMHAAWRERHGIAKETLRQRRKAIGLSAAQASALLGLGVNQYRTYENTDKLPSKSNARLLQMLCDDRALPALLDAADAALTKPTRRNLLAHVSSSAEQQAAPIANIADSTNLGTILSTNSLRDFAATQVMQGGQLPKSAQRIRLVDTYTAYNHSYHAYS